MRPAYYTDILPDIDIDNIAHRCNIDLGNVTNLKTRPHVPSTEPSPRLARHPHDLFYTFVTQQQK